MSNKSSNVVAWVCIISSTVRSDLHMYNYDSHLNSCQAVPLEYVCKTSLIALQGAQAAGRPGELARRLTLCRRRSTISAQGMKP